jgi:hypothetical protein
VQSIKKIISNTLVNIYGRSTQKRIVVFESDDWGSIRMPSIKAYNTLLSEGIPVNKSSYCQYDNLCSTEDIESLLSLLQKHKDSIGNHPVITANAVVANPDFKKIKEADFSSYHYETIDKSFERFFPKSNPMKLWNEGYQQHIFVPQFHGREHVNVPFWLDVLQKKDIVFSKAFEKSCWGISNDIYHKYPKSIQASFDYNYETELDFMKESIQDGLTIFEKLFGYRAESFTPNNYIWPSVLNSTLQENGVNFMQGMKYQLLPKPFRTVKRNKIRRYNGQRIGDGKGILQTVRNVQFEPSLLLESQKDMAVKDCLDQIQSAFFWNKPAIISVHRINFCGTLNVENRNGNLKRFDLLLHEITRRWPDVIFMDSVTLSKTIK